MTYAGWQPLERMGPRGGWTVAERGDGYRSTPERAMLFRPAVGTPLPSWGVREHAAFQRVLERGESPRPFIVVERMRGIGARECIAAGPAPVGQALHAGVVLCSTQVDLGDLWVLDHALRARHPWVRALSEGGVDRANDPEHEVFEVAVAVLCLVLGQPPRTGATAEQTLRSLVGPVPPTFDDLPTSLASTLMRALDPNPKKRPPSCEALGREWREAAERHRIALAPLRRPPDVEPRWLFR